MNLFTNIRIGIAILFWAFALSTSQTFAQNSSIESGLTGESLVSALQSSYYPTSPKSYSSARDAMYGSIDNQSGQIIGVYTGFTITSSDRSDAFSKGINTEHVWPQGYFNSNSPMVGDIHHLYPTKIEANSARSNYPFAEIPDEQTETWFYNTTESSSIPSSNIDLYSESTSSAFEPREDFKGNVARAVFYFWTIYQDNSSVTGSTNENFFEGMKETLYDWHRLDPVDAAEVQRSLDTEGVQGNRNPFIHDTTLVRRAYFESGNGEPDPDPDADEFTENFNNFPETGSSYGSGTFTGVAGNTWNYVKARGDQNIDGSTPGLRNDNEALLETTISSGMSSFSFDYKQLFSTDVNLRVYINGNLETTVTSNSEMGVIKNSGQVEVNYIGDLELEIKQGSGGGQVGVDNFSWSTKGGGEIEISGNAGWRMLSFPITGGTVADISDDTAIQGIGGGDNTGEEPTFLIFKSGSASTDFTTPTDVSTAFGDGFGFISYFYDNTIAGSSELPTTLAVSGQEQSSDVTVTLNTTGDHTLVGNPFASNFDLNEITVDQGTIQNTVQFWDNGKSTFEAVGRDTSIVSNWQGFWVENNGANSITFPTSGKTDSTAAETYFSKESTSNKNIAFTLQSETTFDKAICLSFNPNAELGWDIDDASKFKPLTNEYATMAFVGEDKLQSVFSLPIDLEEEVEVKLQETMVGVSGEFTFAWDGMADLPSGLELALYDYETGESVNMRDIDSYTFEVAESQAKESPVNAMNVEDGVMVKTEEAPRFGIIAKSNTAVSNEEDSQPERFTLKQNYPNPFNPTTSIQYSVENAGEVSLTVYNVMGQQVARLVNESKSAGTYQITWDATNNASGIYYYRLESAGQVITRQMTLIK
jgi:endonuclease I